MPEVQSRHPLDHKRTPVEIPILEALGRAELFLGEKEGPLQILVPGTPSVVDQRVGEVIIGRQAVATDETCSSQIGTPKRGAVKLGVIGKDRVPQVGAIEPRPSCGYLVECVPQQIPARKVRVALIVRPDLTLSLSWMLRIIQTAVLDKRFPVVFLDIFDDLRLLLSDCFGEHRRAQVVVGLLRKKCEEVRRF